MKSKQIDFSGGQIRQNIIAAASPMLVAQILNLLYNIIDRIYIGKIPGEGPIALAGLGLCFPIITMVAAFSNLFGVGGAPLCSIAFHRPLLYLFGASDETYPYAAGYIVIYLLGTIFVMTSLGLNPYINSQGYAKIGMMTVLLGAVSNIVLDPIFIFVLHLGVKGAAVATVISVINSIRQIAQTPVGALSDGATPMISYNYGAKRYGKVKDAVFFSVLRKAVIVAPLTFLLPHIAGLGVNGVFLAEPISNIIGGLACYITMRCTVMKELNEPLPKR